MALNNIYYHIQEFTIMSELPVFKDNVQKELLNRQFVNYVPDLPAQYEALGTVYLIRELQRYFLIKQ